MCEQDEGAAIGWRLRRNLKVSFTEETESIAVQPVARGSQGALGFGAHHVRRLHDGPEPRLAIGLIPCPNIKVVPALQKRQKLFPPRFLPCFGQIGFQSSQAALRPPFCEPIPGGFG